MKEQEPKGMSVVEHLVELRTRLVRAMVGIGIGLVVGLFLVLGPPQLVDIIITTFADTSREYPAISAIGTAEAFTSYMTVALTVGFIIGMPAIVYQLLAFIVPGLTDREQRILYRALPFITLFFIGGIAFGWFVSVPTATRFLLSFSTSPNIQTQPALSDFLRIVTLLLLVNGIVFELPIIIYVMALLGVVTSSQLAQYRRFAVIAIVIIAAVITPTGDPINLAILSLPMYLLYELGIVFARFAPKPAMDGA